MRNTHNYLIHLIYNRKSKSNAKPAREREFIGFYLNFMADNKAEILSTWQTRKSDKQRIRVSINVPILGVLHLLIIRLHLFITIMELWVTHSQGNISPANA